MLKATTGEHYSKTGSTYALYSILNVSGFLKFLNNRNRDRNINPNERRALLVTLSKCRLKFNILSMRLEWDQD